MLSQMPAPLTEKDLAGRARSEDRRPGQVVKAGLFESDQNDQVAQGGDELCTHDQSWSQELFE